MTNLQNFVRREDIKLAIVQAMLSPEGAGGYVFALYCT